MGERILTQAVLLEAPMVRKPIPRLVVDGPVEVAALHGIA